MKNIIEDFKLQALENPKFIESALVTYRQNGIEKSWEVIKAHDSVAVLIYHKEHDSFVLVKQFRPAVYMDGTQDGLTMCRNSRQIHPFSRDHQRGDTRRVWLQCRLHYYRAYHQGKQRRRFCRNYTDHLLCRGR